LPNTTGLSGLEALLKQHDELLGKWTEGHPVSGYMEPDHRHPNQKREMEQENPSWRR